MLYLDNAATTRHKPASVYAAMMKYAVLGGGNAGRGANKLSVGGIREVIAAQEAAAELFGIDNEANIAFTQNATYALNMAILGSGAEHMVVTAMDHNSVLRPAVLHGAFSVAAADRTGRVEPSSVRRCLRQNTGLVVCTHISNVCGTAEPVYEIARAAHSKGALFLLDASQSAGSASVSAHDIGADIIACPGHKGLMGPMGTGILCIKDPERIRAVIVGGTGSESESPKQPETMPDKFHSGTLNIPAVAGLRRGIRFVLKEGVENIGAHERYLANMLRSELSQMPRVVIYGRGDSGIVAFNIEGTDSATAAAALGENIIVRAGYHCAPLAHKALSTENGGAVRVSFGYFNTIKDVREVTDAINRAIHSL